MRFPPYYHITQYSDYQGDGPSKDFMYGDNSSGKKTYLKRDYTPKKSAPFKVETMFVRGEPEPERPPSRRSEEAIEPLKIGYSEYRSPEKISQFSHPNHQRVNPNDIVHKNRMEEDEQQRRNLHFEKPQVREIVEDKVFDMRAGPGVNIMEKSVERFYMKSPEKKTPTLNETFTLKNTTSHSNGHHNEKIENQEKGNAQQNSKLKTFNLPIPSSKTLTNEENVNAIQMLDSMDQLFTLSNDGIENYSFYSGKIIASNNGTFELMRLQGDLLAYHPNLELCLFPQ